MREVVAAALVQHGRLLLAQRRRPAHLAGLWELPGGKVEDGESPAAALERELREELLIDTEAGSRIGVDIVLSGALVLRAYQARLVAGTPTPVEHAALRWVDAAELQEIELVPNDRAWLPELTALLTLERPC
ncbi:NUDIX domain-containing protein [Skermania sp. ID1734]|nr:NUDIX domain-containing protein [Skermania sp. ID1734]